MILLAVRRLVHGFYEILLLLLFRFLFFSFSKGFKAAHVFKYALLRNKASLKNG